MKNFQVKKVDACGSVKVMRSTPADLIVVPLAAKNSPENGSERPALMR